MKASIIIASRNEGANLLRTVESCIAAADKLPVEIIVVDDGSTDGSAAVLLEAHPQTCVVRNERSAGVSAARVAGVQSATGDVLMFFDAHVKPEIGCLQHLLDGVRVSDGAAVIVPMVSQFDTITWQSNDALRGYGYELTLDGCVGRWLELSEMRESIVGGTSYYESPTVVGCSVAVHRRAYDHIMGFDPLMRTWGMEDVDFGIRAWMTGHPVLCDPRARLGHRFVQEFVGYESRMLDLGANQIRTARKLLQDDTFNEWIEMRGLGSADAHDTEVAKFWREAWLQYEEDEDAIVASAADFKARRIMDEYEYANRFALEWPRHR